MDELAELETREHGSPLRKTKNFDVPLCAEQFEYFAGVARASVGETLPVGPWATSYTVREPLGVVGLITPWNFPALMVVWKLGAALVTGNTCIVKPPTVAPLTTLRLAELATEAGAPPGAVNVITGPGGRSARRSSVTPAWPRSASPATPRPASASWPSRASR